MKDTRNFDRAPLKDIRVKDNQVGIRTPQVLIKREGGEYMKGDVLDANATAELANSIHMPDIEKINTELSKTVKIDQIGKANGVASLDDGGHVPVSQLGDIGTDLFNIVSELPESDIKANKIYCVKDTSSKDGKNTYIEYVYLNGSWEKIGEFYAEPDLSGYAKLTGAAFRGNLSSPTIEATGQLLTNAIKAYTQGFRSNTTAYCTDGSSQKIGTSENFTFTLEDGTTVTKAIRVISTTNS